MRPATVWHALMRPPWRFLLGRWPWRTLVYVLSSAAIGFLLLPVTIVTLLLLPLWGIVIVRSNVAAPACSVSLARRPAMSRSHGTSGTSG